MLNFVAFLYCQWLHCTQKTRSFQPPDFSGWAFSWAVPHGICSSALQGFSVPGIPPLPIQGEWWEASLACLLSTCQQPWAYSANGGREPGWGERSTELWRGGIVHEPTGSLQFSCYEPQPAWENLGSAETPGPLPVWTMISSSAKPQGLGWPSEPASPADCFFVATEGP